MSIRIPRKMETFPLSFSLLASLASLLVLTLQVASCALDHGVTPPGSFTHNLVAPDCQLTGAFRLPTRSSTSVKNGGCTCIVVGKWHALIVLTEEMSALSTSAMGTSWQGGGCQSFHIGTGCPDSCTRRVGTAGRQYGQEAAEDRPGRCRAMACGKGPINLGEARSS